MQCPSLPVVCARQAVVSHVYFPLSVLSENEENTVEQVLMCLLPLLYRQYDEPPVKSLLQHLIDQVRSGALCLVLGCEGVATCCSLLRLLPHPNQVMKCTELVGDPDAPEAIMTWQTPECYPEGVDASLVRARLACCPLPLLTSCGYLWRYRHTSGSSVACTRCTWRTG